MPIRGSPNGAHHPYPQLVAIARNGGRDPSERVVVFNWNEWSRSIGIAGRDQPVRAPLPKRWIVERTIAWLNRCRRLAKDWENLNGNALAFVKLASIRLMLRKLCNP
jgi:hypothetical protein